MSAPTELPKDHKASPELCPLADEIIIKHLLQGSFKLKWQHNQRKPIAKFKLTANAPTISNQ